ncbi:hypothetical protein PIIN_09484, partial [Serendipita indica DSM 11827]
LNLETKMDDERGTKNLQGTYKRRWLTSALLIPTRSNLSRHPASHSGSFDTLGSTFQRWRSTGFLKTLIVYSPGRV